MGFKRQYLSAVERDELLAWVDKSDYLMLADAIRDRLKQAGVEVTDTADGPQWTLLDGYSK